MCDCRKDIEAKLLEHFKASQPDATGHGVTLNGYGINFRTGGVSQEATYEASALYPLKKGGTKLKTTRGHMVFSHCPFCGEPVKGNL